MKKVNQFAPTGVLLRTTHNEPVALEEFRGKWLVLYFYPKDETPGCTVEACSFRDNYQRIRELGAEIIGVSKDNLVSHQKFTDKHRLPFRLWSDPELKLIKGFGVLKKKKIFGKEILGTARTTFIIDPEGKIAWVFDKVKPNQHGQEVINKLVELMS